MDIFYKEKNKSLSQDNTFKIICKNGKEHSCNGKILKTCSQFARRYIDDLNTNTLDFSNGELAYDYNSVVSVISVLSNSDNINDLTIDGTERSFVKIISCIQLLEILFIEDYIEESIYVKFIKLNHKICNLHKLDHQISRSCLLSLWDFKLINSRFARFLRNKLLYDTISSQTMNSKWILKDIKDICIKNYPIFKSEYDIVINCLIISNSNSKINNKNNKNDNLDGSDLFDVD